MDPRLSSAALLLALPLAACDQATQREARQDAQAAGARIETALDRTQQKLSEAGKDLGPKVERAGEKLSEAGEKTAEKLREAASSDAAITASIKADILKDRDLSVLKIDVDTREGVVTLNGLAGDEAARERAGKLASGVKGVKEVRNYLAVKRA